MPSYQSESQRAALQAAAELAIDEGDAPFYNSRPIPRLNLGDDDEAVLAAAGPVRPRGFSAQHLGHHSSSTGSGSPVADAPVPAWQEVRQTDSPVSYGPPSRNASLHITRNGSLAGLHESTASANHALGASTSHHRRLEKMAMPRDPQGVPFEPPQPNYGQVLSFAEEEERERQRGAARLQMSKSPRTPRASSTPRLVSGQPQNFAAPTASYNGRTEKPSSVSQAPRPHAARPLSASQQARLEKLAAPKAHPRAEEADGGRPAPMRSSSAAAGSSSGTFDRLYASRKQPGTPMASLPDREVGHLRPETSPRPVDRPPRAGATRTPVPTAQQSAAFERLSRPKSKPPAARDASGLVEYNPYAPVKRYYGGTTYISVAPPPPPATAAAARGGDSRIPKASWENVVRTAPPRPPPQPPAAQSPGHSDPNCVGCGHPAPAQTVEAVPPPATASAAQPEEPRVAVAGRPAAAASPTPAAATTPRGSTVVASAPAKPSGTRPPIVVRTRRYVPPAEEEGEGEGEAQKAAEAAPKPVEATRRQSLSLSVTASPPPVAEGEPTPAPVAAVAATRRRSPQPQPISVPAPDEAAAAPSPPPPPPAAAESTATAAPPAARAVVQAVRRPSAVSRPSPAPAADEAPSAAPAATPTPPPAQRAASVPAAETPRPTQGVVQAVRRPSPSTPRAPAAAPEANTTTLTLAVPTPPAAADAAAAADAPSVPLPAEPAVKGDGGAAASAPADGSPTPPAAEGGRESGEDADDVWRLPPTTAKPRAAATGKPTASVYDRLAPAPLSADKLRASKKPSKKKVVRPPKPEVLRDEEFACQLEDFSPEPHRPATPKRAKSATIHKKPPPSKKKKA